MPPFAFRATLRSVRIVARPLRLVVGAAVVLAGCAGSRAATSAANSPPAPSTAASAARADTALGGDPAATFDTAWAIIGRTYWDTTFGGRDWNAIRDSLRPLAAQAKTRAELRRVLTRLVDSFGESHFAIIPEEVADARLGGDGDAGRARDGDLGLTVRWIDGGAVVTQVRPDGAAAAAGIEPGWVIDAIGDVTLAPVVAKLAETERDVRRVRMNGGAIADRLLQGAVGDTVQLVARDRLDRVHRLAVARTPAAGEPAKFGNLPAMAANLDWERRVVDGKTIGIVGFNVWMIPMKRAFDIAMDSLRGSDAIIVDMRGNPGGVGGLSMGVAGHFIDSVVPVGVMQTRAQDMKFAINPQRVNTANQRVAPFAGPVAVLTDEQSASTTEIFAGGMQDLRRARIIGGTTAGMALPAIPERLPNGDILYHAIANFVTPNGTRIEGPGIRPDHVVTLTRQDFIAGRDPALDAALRWAASAAAAQAATSPRIVP